MHHASIAFGPCRTCGCGFPYSCPCKTSSDEHPITCPKLHDLAPVSAWRARAGTCRGTSCQRPLSTQRARAGTSGGTCCQRPHSTRSPSFYMASASTPATNAAPEQDRMLDVSVQMCFRVTAWTTAHCRPRAAYRTHAAGHFRHRCSPVRRSTAHQPRTFWHTFRLATKPFARGLAPMLAATRPHHITPCHRQTTKHT